MFIAAPKLTYEDRLKQPMTVKSGATVTLSVTASGVPTPTISWRLNDEPLVGDVITKDNTSTVTVKKITSIGAGTYKVTAENEVGSDTAEFVVSVKGMLTVDMGHLMVYFVVLCYVNAFNHIRSSWV